MPAVLKTTQSIGPAIDLTNADESTVLSLIHTEYGLSVKNAISSSIDQLVEDGVTSWAQCSLDRDARTFVIERQFVSADEANKRISWVHDNVPASTTNFTRVSLEVIDNLVLNR